MSTEVPGWTQNTHPCGECRHFFIEPHANKLGGCAKKLMAVLKDMRVLAPVGEPCFDSAIKTVVQMGLKEQLAWTMPAVTFDLIAKPLERWVEMGGRPRPTFERFFRMCEKQMPEVFKEITFTRKPVVEKPAPPPVDWTRYDELYRPTFPRANETHHQQG